MKLVKVTLARLVREIKTAIVVMGEGEDDEDPEIIAWGEDDGKGWALDQDADPVLVEDWDEGTKELRLLGPEDVPKVGGIIYIPTRLFIERGAEDFIGGWATISVVESRMNGGVRDYMVVVEERSHVKQSWNHLAHKQEKLAKEHGANRAYSQPDYG